MSQQFPNLQKVYSYQVFNLSFPGKISASILLQKPTTEHAWTKEFFPHPMKTECSPKDQDF